MSCDWARHADGCATVAVTDKGRCDEEAHYCPWPRSARPQTKLLSLIPIPLSWPDPPSCPSGRGRFRHLTAGSWDEVLQHPWQCQDCLRQCCGADDLSGRLRWARVPRERRPGARVGDDHTSWQSGCLRETETRQGATEARVEGILFSSGVAGMALGALLLASLAHRVGRCRRGRGAWTQRSGGQHRPRTGRARAPGARSTRQLCACSDAGHRRRPAGRTAAPLPGP